MKIYRTNLPSWFPETSSQERELRHSIPSNLRIRCILFKALLYKMSLKIRLSVYYKYTVHCMLNMQVRAVAPIRGLVGSTCSPSIGYAPINFWKILNYDIPDLIGRNFQTFIKYSVFCKILSVSLPNPMYYIIIKSTKSNTPNLAFKNLSHKLMLKINDGELKL